MQELQDHFDQAVSEIVVAVLTIRRGERRPSIPEPLARVTAQAAVDALSRLAAFQHFEDLLRAVRILAFLACPAPQKHRAVAMYCLRPLEKDVLSDVLRQQLITSLPRSARPAVD
jgi:hypothetical protein